jgi:uncharacterized protein (TIGR03435 family)
MHRATLFVLPLVLSSQVATLPTFDAASVKQNTSPEPRSEFHTNPDGVTITNYRLQFLIPYCFRIAVYQMAGVPPWLSINKYDIIARAPHNSSEDQLRVMLQQLLADRFKLKFHREHRDVTGYALMPAKDGPKLIVERRESHEGDGRIGAGRGVARGHMITASQLAEALALYLERPVLDQTGIDGLFNFELHWTPDETQPQLGPPQAPGAPPGAPPPDQPTTWPSLFAAVQEQLGLKLIGERTSIDMFIIDHLQETPTEN